LIDYLKNRNTSVVIRKYYFGIDIARCVCGLMPALENKIENK